MQNKRQHKRYEVDVTEIHGTMLLAKNVLIINISIGGVCLQTEKRLNIGSQYILKIEGKGKVLNVKGSIVWSLISGSSADSDGNIIPIYKTGMKFIDVTDEKINEIVNFIEDHKRNVDKQVNLYSTDGSRLYVRIYIEDPEKAVLNYQESYKVKNLSVGGMLIESEHLLGIESKLPMEIILTDDISIRFLGRITYCHLVKNKDFQRYDVGVEFIEMSESDKEILEEFIRLLDTIDKSPSF